MEQGGQEGRPPAGATPHDLRHYYVSVLIAKGCSVKAVQTVLRHKAATETLETYAHLWDEGPALIRRATDAELGPLVTGEGPSVGDEHASVDRPMDAAMAVEVSASVAGVAAMIAARKRRAAPAAVSMAR